MEIILIVVALILLWGFANHMMSEEVKEERQKKKEEKNFINNTFGSVKEYGYAICQSYDEFIAECEENVPYAPKNPQAALYRFAWRRGIILERIYQEKDLKKEALLVRGHKGISANKYHEVAPENAYGKVRLQFTSKQQETFYKKEIARLEPKTCNHEKKNLACIYIGRNKNDKAYIGQTVNAPELRWAQHREKSTGPYKGNAEYVRWDILKGNVPSEKLDFWESFYIGMYDAYRNGYNSTSGNDAKAYQEGLNT